MQLRAGAGCGTIHFPEALFPIEGFCRIHDDPVVRVLVLECGEQVALVSAELVMLPPELIDKVKEIVASHTKTEKDRIWVHTTHAITTPHAPGAPMGPGGVPVPLSQADRDCLELKRRLYADALMEAVSKAAQRASESTRAAVLGVGRGESFISVNRDVRTPFGWWIGLNPDGETDPNYDILRLDDEHGKQIAAVIAGGLKPCAIDNSQMKENRRVVSSDIPGLACRLMEEALGAPCLFFMGAAGDQVPREQALRETVQPDGTVETVDLGVEEGLKIVERLGNQMARDLLPAVKGIVCGRADPAIATGETSITWDGKGRAPMFPRRSVEFVRERQVRVEGHVLILGDVAFVGLKPEVNCVTAGQLREASPYGTTILISMVNGGQKYMPDAKSYEKITWEAQSSMLMPGAAEAWVEAVTVKLKEMKGARHNE